MGVGGGGGTVLERDRNRNRGNTHETVDNFKMSHTFYESNKKPANKMNAKKCF